MDVVESPAGLIGLLIWLVIIVAVIWIAFWIIDQAFPEPIRMVAKVVVGLIGLLILAYRFLPGL